MYDVLLALHLLSAALAFVTVVMFSAWALGAPVARGDFVLADWAWNVSGAGLLGFGVWLALDVDGYELWDGWILAAIVLLGAATAFGGRARREALGVLEGGAAAVTLWHWLRTASVIGMLILMIWKPGA
jgi:hypothetical protein